MKTLEILISAALAFSIGMVWYSVLFKGHWMKLTAEDTPSKTSMLDYVLIFVSMCTVSYFMNNGCLEMHINGGSLGHGIFHGSLYGLSYAVPIIAIHHVYQKKTIKAFFIDSGYVLIAFGAIGGMLALLPLMEY